MTPTASPLSAHGEHGLAVLAFKVDALQFDLNRDLQFISMKDQVVRARTLILGAQQAGLFGPHPVQPDRANVIVLGGGVGGVSAALMACSLGLSVKLIEAADECFPLLNLGGDRLFSATVYDWPHEHSCSHKFPYVDPLRDSEIASKLRLTNDALEFPEKAVTAATLRETFLKQLATAKLKYGSRLEILQGHEVRTMDDVTTNRPSKVVKIEVHHGSTSRYLTAQIAIFAIGFGLDKKSEQTEAAKDFFSYKNLNTDVAKAVAGGGLVRIIGAGDGGLQEALRFVLSEKWHDLHLCVSELQTMLAAKGHLATWTRLCARLQSAEDQAVRAAMWGYSDELVYGELNAVYMREMEYLRKEAEDTLNEWRVSVVRQHRLRVELVDNSPYSKKAYALNRWWTGLLSILSDSKPELATLGRVAPEAVNGNADVELVRAGFAAADKQSQIGTAGSDDLLRRIAFQGIPMTLDAIV